MEALTIRRSTLKIWKDSRAQDLMEYALLAGFLAVTAGAMVGSVADSINPVFSKIIGVINLAVDAGPSPALPSATQ